LKVIKAIIIIMGAWFGLVQLEAADSKYQEVSEQVVPQWLHTSALCSRPW